ncbi:hypothetical protein ACHAW6_000764, partial [Cyclotella cf. meneghiniana]
MVPDVGPSLRPVENALLTKFLPAVLGIDGPIDNELRTLLGNGVKTRGLAIQDPTLAATSFYSTSVEATDMLTGTLIQNKTINIEAHRNCVLATGAAHQKTRRDGEVAFHTALMEQLPPKVKKQIERATAADAWLSTIPDRFSGTELTKDEWLDNVAIRYGWRPTNLPDQCDSCGTGLMLEHGLSCKQGRLVGICHNNVHNKWAHLCSIAFTGLSQAGVNNATPAIRCTANPTTTLRDEAHGDVLAYGFWNCGRVNVVDVHICDTNSRSYSNTSLSTILERHAKEKKDKYKTACLKYHRDFTPLVYSVNGMASKDAQTAKQCIAWLLVKKWSRTYSDMASFTHTRMSLAI